MKMLENVPLANYTTFKIGGPARFFCEVATEKELAEAVRFATKQKRRIMVLGGGSNILISDAGFSGVVIKMDLKGITIADEKTKSEAGGRRQEAGARRPPPGSGLPASASDIVSVSAAAGEMWDDFVERTVTHGLHGLENLSAIPGTVGATPVQNIGAYGADLSMTVDRVRALDTATMKFVKLSNADCKFSYRDSVFKQDKGRYIITGVHFNLVKNGPVNIAYKDLKDYFAAKGVASPSIQEVRDAVIDIRWKKLPDWKLWGTAGSFFKNPVINAVRYEMLKEKYPDAPGYPEPDGRVKVPAGWLLDRVCGAKGIMDGNVGTYENQALVIVTKPGATAAEVVEFTERLLNEVEKETSIKMEGEVEWVN